MSATEKKDPFRLGFLTALEIPDQGFVGGLLVTNRHGRPLEFQCTAPLKPNRTQEILYGATLGAYVIGEVIAKTLIDKVGVKPHLVLTETPEIMEVRNHVSIPVGCLEGEKSRETDGTEFTKFQIGRNTFRVHTSHGVAETEMQVQANHVPKDADMREPFDRVREALMETVKNSVSK